VPLVTEPVKPYRLSLEDIKWLDSIRVSSTEGPRLWDKRQARWVPITEEQARAIPVEQK
jgi:hypothetical protein